MQILRLINNEIASCGTITIAPLSGDWCYSIGEIGFLHP
jgi:hypothetical protein